MFSKDISRPGLGGRLSLILLAALASPVVFWTARAVETVASIPAGTVLPVRLNDSLDVSMAHVGQVVEARIAQEVPLPGKEKIELRTRLLGSVVAVGKGADGTGARVTIRFTQLDDKKEQIAVATSLRAMASYLGVRAAQLPAGRGGDGGTPSGWSDTVQIGGDIRYGDGGKVRNLQKQTVGKGVRGGVLVQLNANPAQGCEGSQPGDRPQALWVFSADACGVYDLKDVRIAHTGKTDPVGDITLEFTKNDAKLESGTAFLLRTVTKPK